jgi:fatty acid desaturase/cytochrome b involved in lipid metabolism
MFQTKATIEEFPTSEHVDKALKLVKERDGEVEKKLYLELKRKNLNDAAIEEQMKDIVEQHSIRGQPLPQHMSKHNQNYHYIHGKPYDLRKFFKHHPGGKDILEMTQGLIDATPLFESYHAFANRPSIMKQLERYRVELTKEEELAYEVNDSGIYTFEDDGFYRTVTRRVREHFGATGDNMSVTKNTKADVWWLMKISTQFALFVVFYYLSFFDKTLSTPLACGCALLAGLFLIQFGFTTMHDGSHYALAAKGHWINIFATRFWCALSLWVGKVWFLHHLVLHHSFTGSGELDPDEHHAAPFVRKTSSSPKGVFFSIFRWLGDNFGVYGWGFAATLLYVFLPGMHLGQVLMYFAFTIDFGKWKNLWGMDFNHYKNTNGFETQLWEHVLYGFMIIAHIYRANPLVSYCYIVALNFAYSMNIVADHDGSGAAIVDHIEVDIDAKNAKQKHDWGAVQVANSSNFKNGWFFDIFAKLNGSINYQIEHHLFPSLNHTKLPEIAPIVKQTCEEFDVPYAAFPSFKSAWLSFLVTIRSFLTEVDEHDFKTVEFKSKIE